MSNPNDDDEYEQLTVAVSGMTDLRESGTLTLSSGAGTLALSPPRVTGAAVASAALAMRHMMSAGGVVDRPVVDVADFDDSGGVRPAVKFDEDAPKRAPTAPPPPTMTLYAKIRAVLESQRSFGHVPLCNAADDEGSCTDTEEAAEERLRHLRSNSRTSGRAHSRGARSDSSDDDVDAARNARRLHAVATQRVHAEAQVQRTERKRVIAEHRRQYLAIVDTLARQQMWTAVVATFGFVSRLQSAIMVAKAKTTMMRRLVPVLRLRAKRRWRAEVSRRLERELVRPDPDVLREDPLLAMFPLTHLMVVCRTMRADFFKKGESLMYQGAEGHECYVIGRGEGDIIIGPPKARKKVATFGPGKIVGSIGMISGEPRMATLTATTDVAVWVMTRSQFKAAGSASDTGELVKKAMKEVTLLHERNMTRLYESSFPADALGKFPTFSGSSVHALQAVRSNVVNKVYHSGETLLAPGQRVTHATILLRGAVTVLWPGATIPTTADSAQMHSGRGKGGGAHQLDRSQSNVRRKSAAGGDAGSMSMSRRPSMFEMTIDLSSIRSTGDVPMAAFGKKRSLMEVVSYMVDLPDLKYLSRDDAIRKICGHKAPVDPTMVTVAARALIGFWNVVFSQPSEVQIVASTNCDVMLVPADAIVQLALEEASTLVHMRRALNHNFAVGLREPEVSDVLTSALHYVDPATMKLLLRGMKVPNRKPVLKPFVHEVGTLLEYHRKTGESFIVLGGRLDDGELKGSEPPYMWPLLVDAYYGTISASVRVLQKLHGFTIGRGDLLRCIKALTPAVQDEVLADLEAKFVHRHSRMPVFEPVEDRVATKNTPRYPGRTPRTSRHKTPMAFAASASPALISPQAAAAASPSETPRPSGLLLTPRSMGNASPTLPINDPEDKTKTGSPDPTKPVFDQAAHDAMIEQVLGHPLREKPKGGNASPKHQSIGRGAQIVEMLGQTSMPSGDASQEMSMSASLSFHLATIKDSALRKSMALMGFHQARQAALQRQQSMRKPATLENLSALHTPDGPSANPSGPTSPLGNAELEVNLAELLESQRKAEDEHLQRKARRTVVEPAAMALTLNQQAASAFTAQQPRHVIQPPPGPLAESLQAAARSKAQDPVAYNPAAVAPLRPPATLGRLPAPPANTKAPSAASARGVVSQAMVPERPNMSGLVATIGNRRALEGAVPLTQRAAAGNTAAQALAATQPVAPLTQRRVDVSALAERRVQLAALLAPPPPPVVEGPSSSATRGMERQFARVQAKRLDRVRGQALDAAPPSGATRAQPRQPSTRTGRR